MPESRRSEIIETKNVSFRLPRYNFGVLNPTLQPPGQGLKHNLYLEQLSLIHAMCHINVAQSTGSNLPVEMSPEPSDPLSR